MDVAEAMSNINPVISTTEIITMTAIMTTTTTADVRAIMIIAVQHTVNPAIVACPLNG